ncbi:MAG: amidohydrolase family protein [Candidatus Heimdallarchaeota archaeon]
MPGFVNSHVHFLSVLRRGVEDDLPLEQWLGSLPWFTPARTVVPLHQLASKEELAAVYRLVCLEMIKAGITCHSAGTGLLRERYESGLRGFCAFLVTDEVGDYKSVLQCVQKNYSDRFRFGLGPWAPVVPENTLLEVKKVAERHNLKIHMHVAESRREIREIKRKYRCDRSIEYLDRLGLLSPKLVAAHCIHVSSREMDLMQVKRLGIAHCPSSNAKLKDGIAPLVDFFRAKILLGLGSDGPATNNCIDMFQEMKFVYLLQRAAHCDPTVINAKDVLGMATIGGAKLLGMDNKIGSIEIGKRADITIFDATMGQWQGGGFFTTLSENSSIIV